MTAWPALVLAALAATGACPTVCPADGLPEVPTPSAPEASLGPVEEVADRGRQLVPTSPVDPPTEVGPLALLDALAQTHLPTGDDPLQPGQAAMVGAPRSPGADPVQADPAAGAAGATVAEEHTVAPPAGGPTAEGERVHEARAWPTTSGERVGTSSAAIAASLLLGLAGVGLYHKLTKDRALEHPARQRILQLLAEDPGLGTTDVAEELDVCYRTARHHLEVLARFDLVAQTKQRSSWRWARPEDASALEEPHVPELQQRLLALLDEDPGLHLSELARRVDAAKATVKHHLDRLDERGRVRDERVGPLRRFFPDPSGQTPAETDG